MANKNNTSSDGTGFRDIPTMVSDEVQDHHYKTALICGEKSVSLGDLSDRLNKVADALTNKGIDPGDKVAVLAESSIEYVEVFLGALIAGGCVVPLPDIVDSPALKKMIEDSGAKFLFLSRERLQMVNFFLQDLLLEFVGFDFLPPGGVSYSEFLGAPAPSAPPIRIRPEDDFNIIYSSGTTGSPKGIVHSHGMRSFQIARMGSLGFDTDTVTLVSTPLYSNTTLISLLPTLAYGGTVVLMPKFRVVDFLKISENYRVTHAMLVPVQYRRILRHPEFDKYDLSAYKLKLSTSAPMPTGVKEEILLRWPGRFVEIYGVTEGGCTTLLDAEKFPAKLDSVGKPAAGIEIKILDTEGTPLPQGGTGEIAGRALSMMKGYHHRPDLTERITWRDEKGRIFYKTGDLGRLDEDGFLYLHGRKKDIIISGGINIYAQDLEQVLLKHGAVEEAAVTGVPSKRWGETPFAFVVLKKDKSIESDSLLSWANRRLGKAQCISGIEIRESLPRNSVGKILKKELHPSYSNIRD